MFHRQKEFFLSGKFLYENLTWSRIPSIKDLYHSSSVSFDFSLTNAIRRDPYYRKKLLLLLLVGKKWIYFRMKVFIFTISTFCNYLLFN